MSNEGKKYEKICIIDILDIKIQYKQTKLEEKKMLIKSIWIATLHIILTNCREKLSMENLKSPFTSLFKTIEQENIVPNP